MRVLDVPSETVVSPLLTNLNRAPAIVGVAVQVKATVDNPTGVSQRDKV